MFLSICEYTEKQPKVRQGNIQITGYSPISLPISLAFIYIYASHDLAERFNQMFIWIIYSK